jgi:hypothetical protein
MLPTTFFKNSTAQAANSGEPPAYAAPRKVEQEIAYLETVFNRDRLCRLRRGLGIASEALYAAAD